LVLEKILSIFSKNIKEFIQNNYTTHNTVVSIAGNIDHNEIADACKGLKLSE